MAPIAVPMRPDKSLHDYVGRLKVVPINSPRHFDNLFPRMRLVRDDIHGKRVRIIG